MENNYFPLQSIEHPIKLRFLKTPVLFHAHNPRGGGVACPREGCEKSTMEKISSRSVTCRDNGAHKSRYTPRNFHSRPRSSVIPPLRFRFLPAAFLKAITPAIYRAVGHYTHLTGPKITREQRVFTRHAI